MLRKLLQVLLATAFAHGAAAEVADLKPGHPTRYVVKQGDTLWDIASTFLRRPWLWPEVWEQNPQVKNPHRIYVGDVLWVGMEGGRPRLYSRHSRHVKLSPTVRASEHDRVVPPIPLDAIWPFLIQPRVVGPEDLADAPYVVSSQDEHLTPAETNRIYIRGLPPAEPGTQYTVVRCGEVYRDPPAQRDENTRYATLEPVALRYAEDCIGAEGGALGYEALHVADAVLERAGDPATAVITRSNREVLSGDRLLPLTGAVYPEFVPHAPPKPVTGSVISVMDAISQVGPKQVVVLNRGERAGLEPGHVLSVLRSGLLVRDPLSAKVSSSRGDLAELPSERIADLMVFRTFPRVSYALVMAATHPVHLYDAVKNP
ncbi:MAG: LysM peptidoglycan-binding domain-containing protein [Pseudomonadota bacterium]|nr:LysM peptidoglycan-binding domain-containing protein [Pseudomonadota bacterium]